MLHLPGPYLRLAMATRTGCGMRQGPRAVLCIYNAQRRENRRAMIAI